MKFSSLFLLILGFVVVVVAMVLDGGNPVDLVTHPSPLLLVFGGTITIGLMGTRGNDIGAVLKSARMALLPKTTYDPVATFTQLVSFAEVARRDGLLALEEASKDVTDPYIKRGLELIIDGTDADLVAEVLDADTAALVERHKANQQVFTGMGGYAPTLGIVGTVMGMLHILKDLSDPGKLGPLIAVAFLATLWGVASANIIWLPIAAKLKRLTSVETGYRSMVLDGLLAIQSGATPRLVAERMRSHLSAKQRAAVDNARKAD